MPDDEGRESDLAAGASRGLRRRSARSGVLDPSPGNRCARRTSAAWRRSRFGTERRAERHRGRAAQPFRQDGPYCPQVTVLEALLEPDPVHLEREFAPGKRQAMPTMAISVVSSETIVTDFSVA